MKTFEEACFATFARELPLESTAADAKRVFDEIQADSARWTEIADEIQRNSLARQFQVTTYKAILAGQMTPLEGLQAAFFRGVIIGIVMERAEPSRLAENTPLGEPGSYTGI